MLFVLLASVFSFNLVAKEVSRAPQVLTIRDDKLETSDGSTIIEANLQKLRDDYGIDISNTVVRGYILDLNDDGRSYSGFDIASKYNSPFFAKYFHDPLPQSPASTSATKADWSYATTGVPPKTGIEKVYAAVALPEIDHVYFGKSKFGDTIYLNRYSKTSTDSGFESMLHEALHLWHNHHFNEVANLLRSPGSFFDRVKAGNKICANFQEVSRDLDIKPQPACGFPTHEAALLSVLKTGKWPQRYGSLTQRTNGILRSQKTCYSGQTTESVGQKTYCFGNNAAHDLGDMHAFDSEFEYFAILMQLAVFDPLDFKRIATPREISFAKRVFDTDFKSKSVKPAALHQHSIR